jgi:hypothetical protein
MKISIIVEVVSECDRIKAILVAAQRLKRLQSDEFLPESLDDARSCESLHSRNGIVDTLPDAQGEDI